MLGTGCRRYPRASPTRTPPTVARTSPPSARVLDLDHLRAEIRQQLALPNGPAPYWLDREDAQAFENLRHFPPFPAGETAHRRRPVTESIDIVRCVRTKSRHATGTDGGRRTNKSKITNRGGNAVMRRTMLASLPAAAVLALALPTTAGAQTTFSISVNTGADHIRNITLRQVHRATVRRHRRRAGRGAVRRTASLYSGRDVPRAVARGDASTWACRRRSILGSFRAELGRCSTCRSTAPSPPRTFFGIGRRGDRPDGGRGDRGAPGRRDPGAAGSLLGGRPPTPSAPGEPIEISNSLAALEGRRIRIPGGAAIIAAYSALGARCGGRSASATCRWRCSQGTVDGVGTTH